MSNSIIYNRENYPTTNKDIIHMGERSGDNPIYVHVLKRLHLNVLQILTLPIGLRQPTLVKFNNIK